MKKGGKSFDGGPIGYKRPPAEHQFKKGHSRLGGRAKGQKNLATIIAEVLSKRVTVTEGGEAREISFKEALIHKAGDKAVHGTVRDIERFFNLIERLAPKEVEPEPRIIRFQLIEGDDW